VTARFLDYDTLAPADLDPAALRKLLPDLKLHASTSAAELRTRLADATVVMVNKVVLRREHIAEAPHLRLICLVATGTDNVDLQAARERGIAVANIRDYCAPSVAQHVFALILSLNQHLLEYREQVRRGEWARTTNFCLLEPRFAELRGKTLGLVGAGNLGRAVGRLGLAFGMEVVAALRPYRIADARAAGPVADGEFVRAGLGEVLSRAHVLSLHCPLNADTRNLIDATALSRMRRDAILINTARGALVDATALVTALGGGVIAAAGIDVLANEPPVNGNPLLDCRLDNIIVTPHMAWAARESRQRALDEIAANVAAFEKGERRNRVD
jgi:glycerate dehydrogenase